MSTSPAADIDDHDPVLHLVDGLFVKSMWKVSEVRGDAGDHVTARTQVLKRRVLVAAFIRPGLVRVGVGDGMVVPKPAKMSAATLPIFPVPTMPMVLPCTSNPTRPSSAKLSS